MDTDLSKLLLDAKIDLSQDHVAYFMWQLLCGIAYMHDRDVIHRDIKPENLLVTGATCNLKICDFNLARGQEAHLFSGRAIPVRRTMSTHVVTRWYRAPELMLYNDGSYSAAIDVWSAGCVFAELLGKVASSSAARRRSFVLFPGTSCLPMSPATKGESEADCKDQLEAIFDVVGTPSRRDALKFARTEQVRWRRSTAAAGTPPTVPERCGVLRCTALLQVCTSLLRSTPRAGTRFEDRYPEASPAALDLLRKMLAFFPQNRISAREALAHEYFIGCFRGTCTPGPPAAAPPCFDSISRATVRRQFLEFIRSFAERPRTGDAECAYK